MAGAFHSELMRPAADRLIVALETVEIAEPSIPVVANVTGRPVTRPEEIRAALAEQVVSPVLWERSMSHMLTEGCVRFAEPGPGRVGANLMKKIDRSVEVEGFDAPADFGAEGGEA